MDSKPKPAASNLLIHPDEVEGFDCGGGVANIPYVGKWNAETAMFTTGQTLFRPGTGLHLHSHNVE